MNLPPTITVRCKDVLGPDLTFRIRYSLPLRARLRLAIWLAQLAAWIIGAKADIGPEGAA